MSNPNDGTRRSHVALLTEAQRRSAHHVVPDTWTRAELLAARSHQLHTLPEPIRAGRLGSLYAATDDADEKRRQSRRVVGTRAELYLKRSRPVKAELS